MTRSPLEAFLQRLERKDSPPAPMNNFDPNSMVSELTPQVVLDDLMPAIFARGERFAHLKISMIPPGCEGLDMDEWNRHFDEDDVYIDEAEADDFESIDYVEDEEYLIEQRQEEAREHAAEREAEHKCDELKGQAVSLVKDWLGSPADDASY